MKRVLLCSQNHLLVKYLYGRLRDEGYEVEVAEHPAFAVRKVLARGFACAVFDAEPFGLSVEEAVPIVKRVAPLLPVLVMEGALDAQEFPGAAIARGPDEVMKKINELAGVARIDA